MGDASSTRSKKKVMRALGILGENEGISQQALDEYSKMFTGTSSSLVYSHSQALAALFGWAVPEEDALERQYAV